MTATQSGTECFMAAVHVKGLVCAYACIIERRQQTDAFIIQWRNILMRGLAVLILCISFCVSLLSMYLCI